MSEESRTCLLPRGRTGSGGPTGPALPPPAPGRLWRSDTRRRPAPSPLCPSSCSLPSAVDPPDSTAGAQGISHQHELGTYSGVSEQGLGCTHRGPRAPCPQLQLQRLHVLNREQLQRARPRLVLSFKPRFDLQGKRRFYFHTCEGVRLRDCGGGRRRVPPRGWLARSDTPSPDANMASHSNVGVATSQGGPQGRLKFTTIFIVWKWKWRSLKNRSRTLSVAMSYYAKHTPEIVLRLVVLGHQGLPGSDSGADGSPDCT